MKKEVHRPKVCLFSPSSCTAGVTILALVYVNSQPERAGEGGRGHIKRRFFTQQSGKWFDFCFGRLRKRERERYCMFLGCCYGHEERPCDADVVLEACFFLFCFFKPKVEGVEVEENGGILHNWKEVKSPLAGMT